MVAPGPLRGLRATALVRRALCLALGLDAALAWVVVLGVHTFLQRVWWNLAHRDLEPGALERHWAQVEIARAVHGLVWLVTAALFLLWVYRRWASLAQAGGPGTQFTPRAAVAAFLVPVLNLAGGYRAVAGLWRAGGDGRPGTVPAVVAWWWGLFLAATALDPPPLRLAPGAGPGLALGRPTLRLVVAMLVEVAAAVLAIVVVWRTEERLAPLRERRGLT